MTDIVGPIVAIAFLLALLFVTARVVVDPRRLSWRTPRRGRRFTLPVRFFWW